MTNPAISRVCGCSRYLPHSLHIRQRLRHPGQHLHHHAYPASILGTPGPTLCPVLGPCSPTGGPSPKTKTQSLFLESAVSVTLSTPAPTVSSGVQTSGPVLHPSTLLALKPATPGQLRDRRKRQTPPDGLGQVDKQGCPGACLGHCRSSVGLHTHLPDHKSSRRSLHGAHKHRTVVSLQHLAVLRLP